MSNERMLSALRAVRKLQFTDHHRLLEDRELEEIAQRYGPMFTREEIENILDDLYEAAYRQGKAGDARDSTKDTEISVVLSRHTEAEGGEPDDKERWIDVLDSEVGGIHGELIALTKRLAAIEKRLLADGHSPNCKWHGGAECTCHHDKLRRMKNEMVRRE